MGVPLPARLIWMTGTLTVQTRAWSIRPFSTLSRRLGLYAEGKRDLLSARQGNYKCGRKRTSYRLSLRAMSITTSHNPYFKLNDLAPTGPCPNSCVTRGHLGLSPQSK